MSLASELFVLLDTNAVINKVRPSDGEIAAISIITMIEMASGLNAPVAPAERAGRRRFYREVSATFEPLPLTIRVLNAYSDIDAAVRHLNRQPRKRMMDLLIAATARAYAVPLITANLADYAGLGDLVDVRGA